MPQHLYRSWKYTRLLMCSLRCFLSISYLWIMLHAAAVVPVVNEHSNWFFWAQHIKFWISYSSLLAFDALTQAYIIATVLLVLYRLFQYSRCSFCYTNNKARKKVPLNKRMYMYFGPYLLLFGFCWVGSMYSLFADLLRIFTNEFDSRSECMYSKMAIALAIKILVMANALIRGIRCSALLQLLASEPEEEICKLHNFGEHLNLFFLN